MTVNCVHNTIHIHVTQYVVLVCGCALLSETDEYLALNYALLKKLYYSESYTTAWHNLNYAQLKLNYEP